VRNWPLIPECDHFFTSIYWPGVDDCTGELVGPGATSSIFGVEVGETYRLSQALCKVMWLTSLRLKVMPLGSIFLFCRYIP